MLASGLLVGGEIRIGGVPGGGPNWGFVFPPTLAPPWSGGAIFAAAPARAAAASIEPTTRKIERNNSLKAQLLFLKWEIADVEHTLRTCLPRKFKN